MRMPSMRMPRRIAVRTALIMGATCATAFSGPLAAAQPAWEKDPPPRLIEDVLRVEVNFMSASYDTTARVDPTVDEPGTVFNAEDDLKIDATEYLIAGEITLLPGTRHLLRLSGLNTQRSGRTRLARDIAYDDQIYRVNELVDSSLSLRLFGFTYGFKLIANERMELTPTVGVQIGEYSSNAVVRSRVTREPTGDISPVPVVGLDARYDFSRRWSAEGRVQYVTIELDKIEASLLDWRLGVTYRINPHFVVGAGYRSFNIDATSAEEGSSGIIDMSITGPLLYMRASL